MTLRALLDPQRPMMALDSEPRIAPAYENGAGGWAGGIASLLRGSTVEAVVAVPNDRIIYVDCVSRSPFGVPARHRFAIELEPLKTNALVLRPAGDGWQILAAAKQIRSGTEARDVLVGEKYVLPPPRTVRRNRSEFVNSINALDRVDARTVARLLGELDPSCTTPLAREVIERALADSDASPLPARLLDHWRALLAEVQAAALDPSSPVFAWHRGEDIAVCHLVRLQWPPGEATVASSVNDVALLAMSAAHHRRSAPAAALLRKRLAAMLARCDIEAAGLRQKRRAAQDADAYRIAGESIYSYLHDIPARAENFVTPDGIRIDLDPDLTAKENAAVYFRRFKKARSGQPRVAARLATLDANRAYWEHLLWELDRAESSSTDELARACDEIAESIGHRKPGARRGRPGRAQEPDRTVAITGGAIAYVGRSAADNERVTFSVAGPNDLWFHARGIPGAHVVLKAKNPRERPTEAQILEAAALAAAHSRAAGAGKVEVDYTARKHVRKQGKGRVGLVWYTDFETVLVTPRNPT